MRRLALALAAALALLPARAAAWNRFQTAEALNRFGWEGGLGAQLGVSVPNPSLSSGLSGDVWLRLRASPSTDTGLWAHVAASDTFLALTAKLQFVRGKSLHLAADFGLGAGLSAQRVHGDGRAGILATWRFARHFAGTFGGHAFVRIDRAGSPAVSIPLFLGFEIGSDHVSLRPEVEVVPPSGSIPRAVAVSFGLSFR